MYKEYLALNKLQGLIYHKYQLTEINQKFGPIYLQSSLRLEVVSWHIPLYLSNSKQIYRIFLYYCLSIYNNYDLVYSQHTLCIWDVQMHHYL